MVRPETGENTAWIRKVQDSSSQKMWALHSLLPETLMKFRMSRPIRVKDSRLPAPLIPQPAVPWLMGAELRRRMT